MITFVEDLPAAGLDIVTTHFSAHFFAPQLDRLCAAIRRALAPDGVWVVATVDGARVPAEWEGRFLRVWKSPCGSRMRYSLAHTRYFWGQGDEGGNGEEPVMATAALVGAARAHGLRDVVTARFGARGLPPAYHAELAMITSFHDRLLFTRSRT